MEQRCFGWYQSKKQELLRLLELYQANDSTPENEVMIENQHKNLENFGFKKVTEIQKKLHLFTIIQRKSDNIDTINLDN